MPSLKSGHARISKKLWQALGGLSNPDLFRIQKRGVWQYYRA